MLDFIAGFIVFIMGIIFLGLVVALFHMAYLMWMAATSEEGLSEETMEKAAMDWRSKRTPDQLSAYDTFLAIIGPLSVVITIAGAAYLVFSGKDD